jgi:hypothetical protein
MSSSPHTSELSRELQEDRTITPGLQDSLDEVSLAYSSYHDLSEIHQSPNSPASPPEEHMVCSILDMSGEYSHCKESKTPNGLPGSLPFLSVSCLCGRKLSLLQVL